MQAIPRSQPFGRVGYVSLVGVLSVLFLALVLILSALPRYTAVSTHEATWSQSTFRMPGTKPATTAVAQMAPVTPIAAPTGQSINASQTLARIFQLDAPQYASTSDETTWGMSACSTAAITEVINAYGFQYRVADILHVQAQIGAITPDEGLTSDAGIEATAARFGFTTSWGHQLSLDQVIATANSGHPVIVAFPPGAAAPWMTGHILVVRGGNASHVEIVDSSKLNITSLSRQTFLSYWRGASWVLSPPSNDVPAGKPTMSVTLINQVLAHYGSPAAGQGQVLSSLGQQYDIDPAYALAFFFHESSLGTAGMARITHSLGNSRCVQDAACVNTSGGPCQAGQSCYASYASWADGFAGWYRQMTVYLNGSLEYYLTRQWKPLTTLETILPVYAPSSDQNDVSAYISAIQTAVATWRSGKVVVP